VKKKLFLLTVISLLIVLSTISVSTSLAEQVDAVSTATAEPCVADFDCNGKVGLSDLFIFLGEFGRNPNNRPCTQCVSAPLAKTGQIISTVADDDGDLQMGIDWPAPRFTENYTCG
jgi:hypothetical protein